MNLEALLLLLGLAIVVWFWVDTLRARETAIRHCTRTCQRQGWQFLDQALVLEGLGLQRNRLGRLQIRRQYAFAFSTNGEDRHAGLVVVLGKHIDMMHLEAPKEEVGQE